MGGRAQGHYPTTVALTSGQCWLVMTLLISANTRPVRYSQVPSPYHVEVRVVAGRPTLSSGAEELYRVSGLEQLQPGPGDNSGAVTEPHHNILAKS